MKEVLREVCLESVREELAGDDETITYLEELIDVFSAALPGHAVVLEPAEHPTRVLWLPPDGEAMVVWYEHDEFARREPFAQYVVSLFDE